MSARFIPLGNDGIDPGSGYGLPLFETRSRCEEHNPGSAKSLDPQAIRKAILATKGYKGAEGTYAFDQNGDGLHGYNIVKNNNGTIVFDKRVDFED